MNEHQDTADQTGADAAADATEAPKKRRAPRKTAATVAAAVPVAAEATVTVVKKPRAPRKAAAPVTDVQTEPQAALQAEPEAPPVAAPAPRPSRSRKTAAGAVEAPVVVEPAVVVPAPVVAPVAAAAAAIPVDPASPSDAAAVPEAAAGDASAQDAASEASATPRRRERDRQRRKDRRVQGPREDGAVVAPVGEEEEFEVIVVSGGDDDDLVDTDTLFAEVISGDYDTEFTPDADELQADPGKRVLRPEPEAPKLHKVLAQAGIGSRREMEQLIQDGQVSVNGEAAHIGMRIAQGDQIRIADRPIKVRIAPPPARVLAYHKEVGEVVTHHDPEGRPTVFRRLPRLHTGKWLSVGRLDINTEGLLLFTNSGDLANQLMHPRFGVEREYAVRVLGSLSTEQRARLLDGVDIEGQKAAFKSIEDGGGEGINRWYRVVITEGRNREVRKLFDKVGLAVSRLIRIRYGTVVLPRGLKRGVWVELEEHDVRTIRTLASPEQAPARVVLPDAPRLGAKPPKARGQERGGERTERGERGPRGGGEARAERDPQAPRGKGAQHGGDRGDRPRQNQNQNPQAGGANPGQQNRPPRGPRQDGPRQDGPAHGGGGGRGGRGDGDDPLHIPNPLEQTFDKRFVSGSKRITTGFGRPTEEPTPGGNGGGNRKGEPRQPDPMQTSVGYIGAEAYFTRPGGGNKGRGGRRR
jgi:23S rRNA pseudouridine2605 synthase